MNYCQFHRQEILLKAKAADYYLEKSKNRYTNLSEEEKNKIKKYQRRNINNESSIKMKYYRTNKFSFTKYKTVLKIWWN